MSRDESKLKSKLKTRQQNGNERFLKTKNPNLIDFSSNDYLGLAQNQLLKDQIISNYRQGNFDNGSTGSRLLTGNSELLERTEDYLSGLFSSQKTLIFNSGYMANLAFFSAVPQRNDVIIYDELSHASIKDGARLSLAKKISFRHNDVEHLSQRILQQHAGSDIYVVVESVYSMDGDFAPLKDICAISTKLGAKVVVDEAHSTGMWGDNGSGLVCELGLEDDVYARIMTFGKAMGIHGACICGTDTLIDYMVNYSRPFIYTTAPSPFEVIAIQTSFEFLGNSDTLRMDLQGKIQLFRNEIDIPEESIITSESPIKAIIVSSNSKAFELSNSLFEQGFDIRPILSPTVEKGAERLRICLHAFNSKGEISQLCQLLNNYFLN